MSTLSHLNPKPVWKYFEEICKIPRLSKNEGEIRRYLLKFAADNKLDAKEDSTGNIVILKQAASGMENIKTLVLQSHMDMVGEKVADFSHNWATDPVVPYIENDWVAAKGTTLGADDGIGIAAQLAILSEDSLKTGKIECLFTVDEESGMTGANNLDPDFFDGRILINLDSEDEGILYIGCAGGMDTVGILGYDMIPVPKGSEFLGISLTNLKGGHSGDEIHKKLGNSVKIMTRILRNLSNKFGIYLSRFDGGNLRNAIPREAFAVIAVDKSEKESVIKWVNGFIVTLNDELGDVEKDLNLSINPVDASGYVMDRQSHINLLNSLNCCPHGVISWSGEKDNPVETSTNLASVKFNTKNSIEIVTTQRSSLETSKHYAAEMVESCLKLAGADIVHSGGYPGWRQNLNSEILKITRNAYIDLFGKEPSVRTIHAGLECGLIYEKFKGIDMISIGPTIKGAHTPEERIDINTVTRFWNLLLCIISRIPAIN